MRILFKVFIRSTTLEREYMEYETGEIYMRDKTLQHTKAWRYSEFHTIDAAKEFYLKYPDLYTVEEIPE